MPNLVRLRCDGYDYDWNEGKHRDSQADSVLGRVGHLCPLDSRYSVLGLNPDCGYMRRLTRRTRRPFVWFK